MAAGNVQVRRKPNNIYLFFVTHIFFSSSFGQEILGFRYLLLLFVNYLTPLELLKLSLHIRENYL